MNTGKRLCTFTSRNDNGDWDAHSWELKGTPRKKDGGYRHISQSGYVLLEDLINDLTKKDAEKLGLLGDEPRPADTSLTPSPAQNTVEQTQGTAASYEAVNYMPKEQFMAKIQDPRPLSREERDAQIEKAIKEAGTPEFKEWRDRLAAERGWTPTAELEKEWEKEAAEHAAHEKEVEEFSRLTPEDLKRIAEEHAEAHRFDQTAQHQVNATVQHDVFSDALNQRRNISDSLKAGTCPCLPGKDGYADTTPALNAISGRQYQGENLLYLKDHQQRSGFPTGEYVTEAAITNAHLKEGIGIKPDAKAITIHWQERNEAGQWSNKSVDLYNIAQTTDPEKMSAYCAKEREQREQREKEYLTNRYGAGYEPPAKQEKKPGPEITCTSTEPAKYLAQYLAAVEMNGKFKVTPEQGAEFEKKARDQIWARNENTNKTDPYSLSKLCREASKQSNEVVREARAMDVPKHELSMEKSRGRSM